MAVLSLLFFYCTSTASIIYVVEKSYRDPSLGQVSILPTTVQKARSFKINISYIIYQNGIAF
jgi:hypothetical protein